MTSEYEKKAQVFKALCDERRLRILELLRHGEKCTCVLTDQIQMPQSSLSYHMKILCESGIVTGREDGKWTYYKINKSGLDRAVAMLQVLASVDETDSSGSECCR